jgi:hypothetical protein
VVLICIFFMARDGEHFFMYFLTIWISSFEKVVWYHFKVKKLMHREVQLLAQSHTASMMLNLDSQLDWIENHLGDKQSTVLVCLGGHFQRGLKGWKTCPEMNVFLSLSLSLSLSPLLPNCHEVNNFAPMHSPSMTFCLTMAH